MVGKLDKPSENEYDDKGWAPIHHAACKGYFRTVSKILDAKPSQLDIETLDKLQVTPLWLAFSTGEFETVSSLLFYNADVTVTDTRNIGVIEIAIRNRHTKIIQHLLAKHPGLRETVWQHIAEYTTLDCLCDEDAPNLLFSTLNIILVISAEPKMVTLIKSKGIFEKLVVMYKQPDVITQNVGMELMILKIIRNICQKSSVEIGRKKVAALLNTLPGRFISDNKNEVFESILIIMKLFLKLDYFRELMMQGEKFSFLLKFLKHSKEEIQKIETLYIIRKSIQRDQKIQNYFYDNSFLTMLLELCTDCRSEQIKVDCVKTMRKMLDGNENIQAQLAKLDIFTALQPILDLKSKSAVKEICHLISVTAVNNLEMQAYYIKAGVIVQLSKIFKNFKEDSMHEWIIRALWEIAGSQYEQQLMVAKNIDSTRVIILSTSSSSEILQYYGCEILRILLKIGDRCLNESRETIMLHLLNFMKSTAHIVTVTKGNLLSTFKTMQSLCTFNGYRPNRKIQKLALEKNAIQVLHQIGEKSDSPEILIESIATVESILMCNPNEMDILQKEIGLPLNSVMKYVNHEEPMVRSKVCHVLGFFILTNNHQKIIRKNFELPMCYFLTLLETENVSKGHLQVDTAFQLISLKDIISESTPVATIMRGIELLRSSLEHPSSEVVVKASDYVSALSQFSFGLRAAFNSAGFMDIFCNLLNHEDEAVKTAVAVTIATLARSLQGEIILLKRCRKERSTIGLIEKWIQFMTLPAHFMERWLHFKMLKN